MNIQLVNRALRTIREEVSRDLCRDTSMRTIPEQLHLQFLHARVAEIELVLGQLETAEVIREEPGCDHPSESWRLRALDRAT